LSLMGRWGWARSFFCLYPNEGIISDGLRIMRSTAEYPPVESTSCIDLVPG
jgi:hypothetical protein